MKNTTTLILIIFICFTYTACDDVSFEGEISCDDGAIKCLDTSSYVTCVKGTWDESNPTPCTTENSCSDSNISTCFASSNPIDNPVDNDSDKKCVIGSAKCHQNGYVTCGADGYWDLNDIHTCLANIECTDMVSCLRNDITNECEPGSAKCSNDGYVICDKDGHWDLEHTHTCKDGNPCTVIDDCLNNEITENGCEPGSAKCSDGGYVICGKDGHWDLKNTQPCRDGNPCTVIDNCLNNNIAENGCEPGSAKCAGNGYVICNEDGQWPAQSTSCESGSNKCKNIADCLKPNTSNTPECKEGDIRCIGTQYYTCTEEGEWETTPSDCPNNKGCVNSIADCFKKEPLITDPTEKIQCSDDSKQLQVQVNDQWVTLDDCDSKGMQCFNKTDYSICSYKDICSAVDNKYYREKEHIYECKNGKYDCYKNDSGCKSFNSTAMCIYDLEKRNCNSLKRIKNITKDSLVIDNQFVLMDKFKDYFYSKSTSGGVCYRNDEPSYAFTEGSTICILKNDTFYIYICNGNSGWTETKDTCQRCSQTSTLVEASWNPGSDWLTRDKYTLSATCINDTSISRVCSGDKNTIQVKGPNGILSNIADADCSSIGHKCDDSTDPPKCI